MGEADKERLWPWCRSQAGCQGQHGDLTSFEDLGSWEIAGSFALISVPITLLTEPSCCLAQLSQTYGSSQSRAYFFPCTEIFNQCDLLGLL